MSYTPAFIRRITHIKRFKADPVAVAAGTTYTDNPISWTVDNDYWLWAYKVFIGYPAGATPLEADFSFTFEGYEWGLEAMSLHIHAAGPHNAREHYTFPAPIMLKKNTSMSSWRSLTNGTTGSVSFGDVTLVLFLQRIGMV